MPQPPQSRLVRETSVTDGIVANPAESSDPRPSRLSGIQSWPKRSESSSRQTATLIPSRTTKAPGTATRVVPRPLPGSARREQSLLCRIDFGPRTQEFRKFSRSSLHHFRHPPEQLCIRLRKLADRVARAERQPRPVDKPSLYEFVIRRLDQRTRRSLRPSFHLTEPAQQADRHVHTFDPPPFPRRQLVVADLFPRRSQIIGTGRSLLRQACARAPSRIARVAGRTRATRSSSSVQSLRLLPPSESRRLAEAELPFTRGSVIWRRITSVAAALHRSIAVHLASFGRGIALPSFPRPFPSLPLALLWYTTPAASPIGSASGLSLASMHRKTAFAADPAISESQLTAASRNSFDSRESGRRRSIRWTSGGS